MEYGPELVDSVLSAREEQAKRGQNEGETEDDEDDSDTAEESEDAS
jgi:hypothetical protein